MITNISVTLSIYVKMNQLELLENCRVRGSMAAYKVFQLEGRVGFR